MRFAVLACILEAFWIWLGRLGDLRQHVVESIAVVLLAGVFYLVSCYFALGRTFYSSKTNSLAVWLAAAGAVFRFTAWPILPTLSDDPYRYRWEGKLQAVGGNPYEARPNDARWFSLRDETFPWVTGKDFKTVYGPLMEQVERWTYVAVASVEPNPTRQVFWFKVPFAICDLGTIAALRFLLAAKGLPAERLLVYAWCPLPILEFWANGHNDSLAVILLILALLAAAKERWTWAFVALSFAAAAKIWPLLLFPLFVGWQHARPQRWYHWWVAIPIFGLLAWPYRTDVIENMRFMSGFVGGWRNNDSLFGLLLWIVGDLYAAKKIAFGILAAFILAIAQLAWPLERAVLAVLTVMLMISANCHPWYLTWILPLLVFVPLPALLLWTCLAPLAHSPVIAWAALGEWQGSPPERWYQYVPVYGMLAGSWLLSRPWTRCQHGQ